ncbi:Imm32 family immunity protein [Micromonospora zhanjiangensis]
MASAVADGHSNDRSTSRVDVEVAVYDPALGVATWWNDGTVLRAEVWDSPERTVVISGNPAGLVSLARHLLTLAQDAVPDGRHLDFDTYCGWLEEGSAAIRIEVEKK